MKQQSKTDEKKDWTWKVLSRIGNIYAKRGKQLKNINISLIGMFIYSVRDMKFSQLFHLNNPFVHPPTPAPLIP